MGMTRTEFADIVDRMKEYFNSPRFIPNQTSFDVWYWVLQDYTPTDVERGFMAFIATDTKAFSPVPGQIVECIKKSTPSDELDPMQAWSLVSDAIGDSIYHATEEFNALPAAVRKTIRDPRRLKDWAMMDIDTVQSVIQSNFIKAYSVTLSKQHELDKLPSQLRAGLETKAPTKELPEKPKGEIVHVEWSPERARQIEQLRKSGIVG